MHKGLPSIAFALVVAWVCMGSSPAHGQPSNNDYYASRGTELLRAVETYHLQPGEDKMRTRQYDSAYGDFKFILNYFPNHPQALLRMAQLCEAWKAPSCRPEEFFEAAIARNSNVAGTLSTYGIYLTRAKKPGLAIETFKRALAIDPESVNAHYNIALAYLDNREYALANEHAQRAYALGAGLPGLRDRLQRGGYWKPLAPQVDRPGEPSSSEGAPTSPSPGPETSPAK